MFQPHIKQIQSSLDPFSVYQKIYAASSHNFFLDSLTFRKPDQRYSYFGIRPALVFEVDSKRWHVLGDETASGPVADWRIVFRRLFRAFQNPLTVAKQPFFQGGWVGYVNYEAAQLFDTITFSKKKRYS